MECFMVRYECKPPILLFSRIHNDDKGDSAKDGKSHMTDSDKVPANGKKQDSSKSDPKII